MAYTLDEFAADGRRILQADPGPAGRGAVRKRLQDLLMNDDFVAAHCGPNASVGTNLLYEDPELGFQILAHIMDRDYAGGPHDHGDSWAIYGQAVKHTEMSEWKCTDDGAVPGKATIENAKTYRMRGQSGIFQNRAVHSIAYPAGARFIRVTGTNLENIARGRYNSEAAPWWSRNAPTFAAPPELQSYAQLKTPEQIPGVLRSRVRVAAIRRGLCRPVAWHRSQLSSVRHH